MKKETQKNNVSPDSTFNLRLVYSDYPILHTHDFWEFMLVTNGSYNHKINGKSIEIKKNILCLIRPADRHFIERLSEKVSHINFVVPDEIMHTQLDTIVYRKGEYEKISGADPIYFEVPERALQNYLEIASRINLLDPRSMQWHYTMAQMFLMFIQDLLKNLSKQHKMPHEDIPKKVKEIVDAIHFSDESSKTLTEIISKSNYSYIHASRMFKTHMNTTLKKYYMKVKMNAATRLLEDPSLSIIQVAEKLGYNSLSYFNILFKDHFNISPSKYRKYWTDSYSGFEDA